MPKPEALAHDEAAALNLGKVREDLRHDPLGVERLTQLDCAAELAGARMAHWLLARSAFKLPRWLTLPAEACGLGQRPTSLG